jgi:hypothetical protein
VLDVDVLADGSALSPGNPRLRVGVHPEVYERDAVWSAFVFFGHGHIGIDRSYFAACFILQKS